MQTLEASWLRRSWIERREIERWETLLMQDEMSVKTFRRQVTKCATATKTTLQGLRAPVVSFKLTEKTFVDFVIEYPCE